MHWRHEAHGIPLAEASPSCLYSSLLAGWPPLSAPKSSYPAAHSAVCAGPSLESLRIIRSAAEVCNYLIKPSRLWDKAVTTIGLPQDTTGTTIAGRQVWFSMGFPWYRNGFCLQEDLQSPQQPRHAEPPNALWLPVPAIYWWFKRGISHYRETLLALKFHHVQ